MRPYRKEKVASAIRQIVSEAIAHRLSDPRIAPLTTVTRVEMADDLLVARVYVTVTGGEAAERRTLAALHHATGYLQRMIAGNLSLRQCPELRLDVDKNAKAVRKTMELLSQNLLEDPGLSEPVDDGKGSPEDLGETASGTESDAPEGLTGDNA